MRPIDRSLWRQYYGDGTTYQTTRSLLVQIQGTYCSYCEVPLADSMPVEHKAPKAESAFTDFASKFTNLTLSCTACNIRKGVNPTQQDAINLSMNPTVKASCGNLNISSSSTNYYWCGILNMVWPDITSDKGQDIPDPPSCLQTAVGGFPDQTANLFLYVKEVSNANQLADDGVLRFETADQADQDWASTDYECVWIYPNDAWILALDTTDDIKSLLTERVEKTITQLNLNHYNPTNPTASDRRVASRNAAWNTASEAAGLLTSVVGALGGLWSSAGNTSYSPTIYSMVKLIRQSALAVGHWSVWMTVFQQEVINSTNAAWSGVSAADRTALVNALFVQYAAWENIDRLFTNQPDPPTIFLGTDPDRSLLS